MGSCTGFAELSDPVCREKILFVKDLLGFGRGAVLGGGGVLFVLNSVCVKSLNLKPNHICCPGQQLSSGNSCE